MKRKTKIALALTCVPVVLSGLSNAATVVVQTALSGSGAAPSLGLVPISTGAIRSSGTAQPNNAVVSGRMSPEVSGTPSSTSREEGPTSGRPSAAGEEGPTSGRQSAAASEEGGKRAHGPSKTARTSGAAPSSKDAIAPEIVYDDPGAFALTVEGGYSSKHVWRGIDIPQFASRNFQLRNSQLVDIPNADSDVYFLGASAAYKGFLFGLKYIQTFDNSFNPWFSPSYAARDDYSEMILTLNYTRMLVGPDWLLGTAGFDFYYYPNDDFWGVNNQGMFYLRLSCPHYKWVQPFADFFYNIALDSSGNAQAQAQGLNAELVEGRGVEFGIKGGDTVWSNGQVSVAATYSISTIYKQGYFYEDDGFTHMSYTVGLPISIGKSLTITPSVSFVDAFDSSGDTMAPAWNDPGWLAGIKASYRF